MGGIYPPPPPYARGLTDRDKNRPIFWPIIFKRVWTLCYEQLQQHASQHKFITEEHFAYSRNSYTITPVLKAVDERKWAMDNILLTSYAFLVLKKAFHVIHYSMLALLNKLEHYGIWDLR